MTRSRIVALVAALVVLAAIVVAAVVILRDPGSADDDSSGDAPSAPATDPGPEEGASTSDEPTAASTDPGHSPDDGHHHIDDVDPDIDPADYEEFCQTFLVLADAYSQRTADRTPETIAAVEDAAEALLAVGDETDLTDEVRAGFEAFVADLLEQPVDATEEELGAFSTFLNSACPA